MKICPKCRRRFPNSQTSCPHDAKNLYPLWYSYIRVWHFGIVITGFGLRLLYSSVVEPLLEARTHSVSTIHIVPQIVVISPLMIALGIPFLIGFREEYVTKKVGIAVGAFGVILAIALIVALARLGYPLR